MKLKVKQDIIVVLIMIVVNISLFFLPTGFEDKYNQSIRSKALVLSVDDSHIEQRGIVKTGVETVKIKIQNGQFKGKEFSAPNELKGQLELDKMFKAGG